VANEHLLDGIMGDKTDFNTNLTRRTTGNAGAIAMNDVKRIKFDDVLNVSDLVSAKRLDRVEDSMKPVPVFKLAIMHINGEGINRLANETHVPARTMRLIIQSERFQQVLSAMGEEVKNSALTYMKGLALSAVSTLADGMSPGNKMSDRIKAATTVLDRVGLNPVNKHAVTKDNSPSDAISNMSEKERKQLLKAGMENLLADMEEKTDA